MGNQRMRKLPRIGQRVRDTKSGELGRVVQILADSGPGGAVHIVIEPDGQRDTRRAVTRMAALQDVEALH
jgi:hypothetical protein